MKNVDLESIFRNRPFKIRNADEYDTTDILSLFVSPINGLATPFDFENSIIKGRMGSGKTMYLRANHAYYLSIMVPSLIEKSDEIVLPVMIKLNDFQHISEPQEIYRAIVIKVIEELTSIYLHLEDMKGMASLQSGLRQLPEAVTKINSLSKNMRKLSQLESSEYIETVSSELGLSGGIKPEFFNLSASWKKNHLEELKKKPNPGIKDIEECYKNLLGSEDGKVLLLIDEAGSLDKAFFRNDDTGSSFFEILMNQFRTASFIRTKIAVYPHSFSDMLTETRYGDSVHLEDIVTTDQGYRSFRKRIEEIVKNYLNPKSYEDSDIKIDDIFYINRDSNCDDSIEQLIYASNGNMRRMIQLLDTSMETAYSQNSSAIKVNKQHALIALSKHATNAENLFNQQDCELLETIASVCKARTAFKFEFPNIPLYKYTNKSQEFNIVKIEQVGSGRRPTIYSFDYSYCILKDIPTHRMLDSEKVDRNRSASTGRWIDRKATISDELIKHANLPGKQDGNIEYIKDDVGLIKNENDEQFFFRKSDIIETDKNKPFHIGKRIRFFPINLGDVKCATLIELL